MGELRWSTADPDLSLLGRLGLGAMTLTLDSGEQGEEMLKPLKWTYDATSLHLYWPEDVSDRDALLPLVKYAWQTRKPHRDGGEGLGVFYLPAIHRGSARDDHTKRLVEHNGLLNTFLQHPLSQPKWPKGKKVNEETVQLEDVERVVIRYKEPAKYIKYTKDFENKLFSRKGRLKDTEVSFPSFLYPGATGRYRYSSSKSEASWQGSVRQAFPMFFAPLACYYLQLPGGRSVVVAPDARDLEMFVRIRPGIRLGIAEAPARSLADAGLRVLVAWRTRTLGRSMEVRQASPFQCLAIQLHKPKWNRQTVRTDSARIRPTKERLDRYEVLHRNLPNRYRHHEDEEDGFIWVPRPRGPIADNLVEGEYWYRGLFEVPTGERDAVQNASRKNESVERAWFRLISYDRNALRNIMQEMPGDELSNVDDVFTEAFHHALRRHFAREAERAKRGTRSKEDRWGDLVERIRRKLTSAGTRPILRAVLSEFFSEAGSTEELREHRGEIWDFIDSRRSWRRARDLALLSLATYSGEGEEMLEELAEEEGVMAGDD